MSTLASWQGNKGCGSLGLLGRVSVGVIQSVLEDCGGRHGEVLLLAQLQDLVGVAGRIVQVESLQASNISALGTLKKLQHSALTL